MLMQMPNWDSPSRSRLSPTRAASAQPPLHLRTEPYSVTPCAAPFPPYETEYGNEALFQQPQEMGDLMGFYQAFGLTVRVDEHERCDHISCKCRKFLLFLLSKKPTPWTIKSQRCWRKHARRRACFYKTILAVFSAFAKKLSREDRAGFY